MMRKFVNSFAANFILPALIVFAVFSHVLKLLSKSNSAMSQTPASTDEPMSFSAVPNSYASNIPSGMLTGVCSSNGLDIRWRGTDESSGADPLIVLLATIQRLEFEQGTVLASDGKAKALVLAMQARDALSRTQPTEMPDGTPIIQ